MGRAQTYTKEYYEQSAQDAANRMGRKDAGYSKEQVLEKAGLTNPEGEAMLQHWPKLRKAFARIGVTLCYINGVGWKKGATGEDGNMVEMVHVQLRRLAKGFRGDVVAAMDKEPDLAVASLISKGYHPAMMVTLYLFLKDQQLPAGTETNLFGSLVKMLPELPKEQQDTVREVGANIQRVAALLPDGLRG